MKFGNIDISEFKKFKDQIDKMNSEKLDEFMEYLTRQLATIVLSRAIFNTPVISGDLRRGWTGGVDMEPAVYVANTKVEKAGKMYSILLRNGMHYASYVEYGHSQQVGRYVPAIKKRLVNSWVKGQFMAEKSVVFARNNFTKIGQIELERFLKKNLNV